MSTASSAPVASTPGFGYVFISLPYIAQFQAVGQYFHISYLPNSPLERLDGQNVCVWLGPEYADTEMLVFLIWPGKGIISFGTALSIRQPSRLVNLISDTGSFETHTPNMIIHELLHVNRKPCILFVRWPAVPTLVVDEATELSFTARAQYWVNDLVQFLEGGEHVGDSFPASKLQEWYASTLKILRSADPKQYLFDPTVFLARMFIHLRSTLVTVNHFDINGITKSKGPIFVPLCFIRSWKEELLKKLHGNQTILSEFVAD